ncbi:hypothetical protein IQ273_22340 [Nodosilinea sp. LEGE 07298]|uniref:hypothetical protein n=1 Tax=Nodosilinea sp. LEGE 07298 TaxID=2777970 RepID=UPI00187E4FBE|nr:hypothetical protein [Nodosilinea sp. LEGE 07298]MBE9112147.1 hypothetical protein [Nodosilinea sp. LEGE 07298]
MSDLNDKRELSDSFLDLFLELVYESDRAAVVLGAAKLDELLRELLESQLIPPRNSKDNFTDSDGPLGTFSARAQAAYRLGLLSEDVASKIDSFRRIRNEFAHRIDIGKIEDAPIADRISSMAKPLRGHSGYDVMFTILKEKMPRASTTAIELRLVWGVLASRILSQIANSRITLGTNSLDFLPPNWKV